MLSLSPDPFTCSSVGTGPVAPRTRSTSGRFVIRSSLSSSPSREATAQQFTTDLPARPILMHQPAIRMCKVFFESRGPEGYIP